MTQNRLMLELLASVIPEWMDDAACKGKSPDLWFPEGYGKEARDRAEAGKQICRTCPCQQRCFDYSIATRQRWGTFGGVDERTRGSLLVATGPLRADHGDPGKISRCTDGPSGGMCNDCREARNRYLAGLRQRKREAS